MSPRPLATAGWRETWLGDLLKERIKNGYSPVCPSEPTGKWILHLGSVTANGFNPKAVKPAPSGDSKIDSALLAPGDVVVSRSNTRERVGFAGLYQGTPAPCAYPDLLMRVRPGSELEARFLLYVLLSPRGRKYFEQSARGTSGSMVKIDRAILENFPLLLPPLPEQRKIASILSSVDDTIEKTQAVIDQLEVVKKGLLGELLTRGMPGRHKEFRKTEIGEVPSSWRTCRLDEVAEIRTGLAKNSKKLSSSVVELPYLRVANVQDGYLDLEEIKTIPVDAALVERYMLRDGDVLFNEGGDADKVGRGTVWRGQLPQCVHQNHVFAVRPSRAILSDFLSLYGGSARGKSYFLDAAKQTTNLASINSSQLKALPVPVPPLDEQREIVEIAESLRTRREAEENSLSAMQHLKTALLESLLSGKVRVSTHEQEAA
jgi:type I restriction enzyme, S subunit